MKKTKELKRYAVTVKHHCANCGGSHLTLASPLVYMAANPREAARKAHEWLEFGGPYGDLCFLSRKRNIFFYVKESYLPRGEGITLVEQSDFIEPPKKLSLAKSRKHPLSGLSREDLVWRLRKTENVIMNAIRAGDWDRDEAATVLQAIGYTLLDEELYPDEDEVWPPAEDDVEPEELKFKNDVDDKND